MHLKDFLNSLAGQKIFFDPLHGNHGDNLLTLAARFMLKDAALTMVENPQAADIILLNGGGSMVQGWSGLKRLAHYCDRFPEIALAVLPSSFYPDDSRLVEIVRHRKSPLWLWAREESSLELLQSAGLDDGVTLGVDHDLAFFLDHHPLIESLRQTPANDTVLVVERDDWEGPTGRRRAFAPSGLEFLPEKYRTLVRRYLFAAGDPHKPVTTVATKFPVTPCGHQKRDQESDADQY